MKLDRTTYEAWLLDRIEGKLTSAQERELDAFLAANPGLNAEPGELPSITDDGMAFSWKDELKKQFPPMGNPDAARIDDFLIARLEGDLDGERSRMLDRLLYEQPQLQRNAELIAATKTDVLADRFGDKASIARHFPPQGMPDVHRLDDFLVARMEGDLTLQQRTALDVLIASDAQAAKQWAVMQRTRVPNAPVIFQGKEELKKKAGRVIPIGRIPWVRIAAAASVALVLGLGWLLLRNGDPEPRLAGTEEEAVNEEQVQQEQPAELQTLDQDTTNRSAKAPVQDLMEGTGPQDEPGNAPQQERHLVVPRQRKDAPAMADVQRPNLQRDNATMRPVQVEVPTGLPPAPLDEAMAAAPATPQHQTIGELLAGAVRSEVLGQQPTTARVLDGHDAVAAIDKGLGAISGDRAGLSITKETKRSRFRLQLGNVALSASRGR